MWLYLSLLQQHGLQLAQVLRDVVVEEVHLSQQTVILLGGRQVSAGTPDHPTPQAGRVVHLQGPQDTYHKGTGTEISSPIILFCSCSTFHSKYNGKPSQKTGGCYSSTLITQASTYLWQCSVQAVVLSEQRCERDQTGRNFSLTDQTIQNIRIKHTSIPGLQFPPLAVTSL